MGSGVGRFFLMLVLGCWVYVIGHQLGFDSFNPHRYAVLEIVLPIAYVGAGLSICFLAGIVAILVKE